MPRSSTDTIQIKHKRVLGLVNPKLSFHYYSEDSSPNFVLYVDGEKKDYQIARLVEQNQYTLESAFSKNAKRIKLVLLENEEEHVLWSFRNIIALRVLSKVENVIRVIISKFKNLISVPWRFIKLFWNEHHFLVPKKLWRDYFHDFRVAFKNSEYQQFYDPFLRIDYLEWIHNQPKEKEEVLNYKPCISILIPVYNIGDSLLTQCVNSILNQTYQNFEICLADDCSTDKETVDALKRLSAQDSRIKVTYRKENGHISLATNSAFELATGEFIALMDNDDLLAPNALYEVAKALNYDQTIDFIYSDEDKIDEKGLRCYPHFKPDYSPDTLLSLNYICHFSVIRKTIFEAVGGFEKGLEGAQDYDLFLKVVEQTNRIHHIHKILYHWRMIPGSTAASLDNKDYAADKGKIAIKNALKRRGIAGEVEVDAISSYYKIKYENNEPLVSIIIPMKDYADVTERCLASLYEKTLYKNFEVLLVNNRSSEAASFTLFEAYAKQYKNFKVIDADMEFNYSRINNLAVKQAKGEVLIFLNNDTEIISASWLSDLVGYALQKHVGAVGGKLLYPDLTVQHAGVIMGLGGVASHAYIGSSREHPGIYGRLRVPYNYSGVTAACLAIRKNVFDEVNGFEEKLQVAYNDVDLNLKLLSAGYYNVFLPQVELIHYESKSRGLDTQSEKFKRFQSEQRFMCDKWNKQVKHDVFYNDNFSYHGWFVLDRPSKH